MSSTFITFPRKRTQKSPNLICQKAIFCHSSPIACAKICKLASSCKYRKNGIAFMLKATPSTARIFMCESWEENRSGRDENASYLHKRANKNDSSFMREEAAMRTEFRDKNTAIIDSGKSGRIFNRQLLGLYLAVLKGRDWTKENGYLIQRCGCGWGRRSRVA